MSEPTKHTPGPWRAEGHRILGPSYAQVADIPFSTPQEEANARLIAAAPELLEAVVDAEREACNEIFRLKLLGASDGPAYELWTSKRDHWQAVITKATGQGVAL